MRVYFDAEFKSEKGESTALLKKAFDIEGISSLFDFVSRTDFGKPYVEKENIYFSISHSRNVWLCAFSTIEIGIDLEFFADKDFEKIANRFFSENERQYLKENKLCVDKNCDDCGLDYKKSFFDIWVRKEAAAKLSGSGLFKNGIDAIETVEQKNAAFFLKDNTEIEGLKAYWNDGCESKKLKLFIKERLGEKGLGEEDFALAICSANKESVERVVDIGKI